MILEKTNSVTTSWKRPAPACNAKSYIRNRAGSWLLILSQNGLCAKTGGTVAFSASVCLIPRRLVRYRIFERALAFLFEYNNNAQGLTRANDGEIQKNRAVPRMRIICAPPFSFLSLIGSV